MTLKSLFKFSEFDVERDRAAVPVLMIIGVVFLIIGILMLVAGANLQLYIWPFLAAFSAMLPAFRARRNISISDA